MKNMKELQNKIKSKLESKKSEIFPKSSGIGVNVQPIEIGGQKLLIMTDDGLKKLIQSIVKMTMIASDAMPEFFSKGKKK